MVRGRWGRTHASRVPVDDEEGRGDSVSSNRRGTVARWAGPGRKRKRKGEERREAGQGKEKREAQGCGLVEVRVLV
jgi:hypothetical protein